MKKKKQDLEIRKIRNSNFSTKRVTVKKLESILYKSHKVLDHGFVRVIDYMGDDSSIVQAARVSYGKGTKKLNQDKNLINYLLSHKHTTPFEMNEIKFHIKLPIFVARQWIRHRTANVNEYSARYSILDNEFYIPKLQNVNPQSSSNNQGRGGKMNTEESKSYVRILKEHSKESFSNYNFMLNRDEDGNVVDKEKSGLARELARMALPLNSYTQWYWKIDLHNLMHFLALRFDVHAQYEIRVYAKIMLDIVKKWVPLTFDAFIKNRAESLTLSSEAITFLKAKLKKKKTNESSISKRELENLKKIFEI
ncbi:MAG: thymidylate synthase (FAD) [Rickettsiales bacterium]|nr:thymidylate synthase (FAD) [Rickettsiales bacterium]